MFTERDPVLSVFLNTGGGAGQADFHRSQLHSMLKRIPRPLEIEVVEGFFTHEYDWSGKSVALFTCHPQQFFRTYILAVPLRNRVQFSDRPAVQPLANLLENYGGYGVALVDKQGARLTSTLESWMSNKGSLGTPSSILKKAAPPVRVPEGVFPAVSVMKMKPSSGI
jgi:hypothetical protein